MSQVETLSSDELSFYNEVKKTARKLAMGTNESSRKELADKYRQWLEMMKKKNPKYDEVVVCSLFGGITVKRKDIPKLIEEGNREIDFFLRILSI
jgi:hypothetical protein